MSNYHNHNLLPQSGLTRLYVWLFLGQDSMNRLPDDKYYEQLEAVLPDYLPVPPEPLITPDLLEKLLDAKYKVVRWICVRCKKRLKVDIKPNRNVNIADDFALVQLIGNCMCEEHYKDPTFKPPLITLSNHISRVPLEPELQNITDLSSLY